MNICRWHQPVPRWARIGAVMLGLTSVGAAIAKPSIVTLAGMLIGTAGMWSGCKGIPLIASVHCATKGQGIRITEGLRTLRRRGRLVAAVGLVCALLTASLTAVIPPRRFPTVILLAAVPALACILGLILSACPRCEHYFFLSNRLPRSLNRCQHCGLAMTWVRPPASQARPRADA